MSPFLVEVGCLTQNADTVDARVGLGVRNKMLTVLILVNGDVIRELGLNFKLCKNGSMGAVVR